MIAVRRNLREAARIARRRHDRRVYHLGAIARRRDGALVRAHNGNPVMPTPAHHCEARLARKLDVGAVVYLARTLADGSWALARPCPACLTILAARGVARVYYTIAPHEYGVIKCS